MASVNMAIDAGLGPCSALAVPESSWCPIRMIYMAHMEWIVCFLSSPCLHILCLILSTSTKCYVDKGSRALSSELKLLS